MMHQRGPRQSISSQRSSNSGMVSPTSSAPPHRNHDHDRTQDRKSKPEKYSPELSDSEDDGPRIPIRRPGQPRHGHDNPHYGHDVDSPSIPPGFQIYPVQEVDSRKKRAATLGLGRTHIILVPDKSSRPKEEWGIENLTGYNLEGKHVFLELEKPTRSLDLHAGSKDVAEEIVSVLSEIRAPLKAAVINEAFAAASGGKRNDIGTVLCDFAAQGEDEVSVTTGDEVQILDDSNDEWWLVRRQVNGMEGVVPASFVERGRSKIVNQGPMASPSDPKERVKMQDHRSSVRGGGGIPQRTSSLAGHHARDDRRRSRPDSVTSDQAPVNSGKQSMPQPNRSRYRKDGKWAAVLLTATITEPDSSQVRQWTDRTGNFKVEAQFIGCKDGKINLHKLNGVKIAVPVSKMSLEDLEYVEKQTGISLDEDKPLSGLRNRQKAQSQPQAGISIGPPSAGSPQFPPSANQQPSRPADGYDWFDFFLSCGVEVNNCQRYAFAFQRDNMDESVLEVIAPDVMRTLGLKEGDILRVMKKLDEKYGRSKKNGVRWEDESNAKNPDGSLFSGPGGTLKNNTRKGRPAPAMQTPDSVDPKAFEQQSDAKPSEPPVSTPKPPAQVEQKSEGFDDNAWEPKPTSKPQSPPPQQSSRVTSPPPAPAPQEPVQTQVQQPAVTGALGDLLSLSTPPLQPTIQSPPTVQGPPAIQSPPTVQSPPPPQPPPPQSAPPVQQLPLAQAPPQQPAFVPNQTGFGFQNPNIPPPPSVPGQYGMQPNPMNTFSMINQPQNQLLQGRQRPIAPTIQGSTGGSLSIPPPPARPLSAPQNFTSQPNGIPNPLMPSYTGNQQPTMNYGTSQAQQFPFRSYVGGVQGPMVPQPTGAIFPNNIGAGFTGQTNMGMSTMGMNEQSLNSGIQQPMPQHPPAPGFQAPIISHPTGALMMQPYGIPQHQTGFQPSVSQQPTGRGIGINSILPPPLIPQPAGLRPAPTLLPQKTGPPPSVKFGVDAKKLTPQPTGRANLSKASTYISPMISHVSF